MAPKRRPTPRSRASSRTRRTPHRRSPSPVKPSASRARRTTGEITERGLPSTILADHEVDLPSMRTSSNSRGRSRVSADEAHPSASLARAAEQMDTHLSRAGPPRQTVSIHDVDPWLRFNVYVRRGYRPSRLSVREAVLSMFLYLHNETVNIFSHFLPFLLTLYWTIYPPVTPFFWTLSQQLGRHDSTLATGAPASTTSTRPSAAASATTTPSTVLASRWSSANIWGDRASSATTTQPPTDASGASSSTPSASSSLSGAPVGAPRGGGPFSWFLRNPIDETVGRATAPLLFPTSTRWSESGAVTSRYPQSDPRPLLSLLCLSFSLTFFLSVVYHVFMPCPHTERGYRQLIQCDVTGVLISISGSVYVYFHRGSPCASPVLTHTLEVLMWVSSVLTFYVLIIAPVQQELWYATHRVGRAFQYTLAELICTSLEYVRGGRPLEAPHPQSANLLWHWLWRGHCRFRRWRRDGRLDVLLRDLQDDEYDAQERAGAGRDRDDSHHDPRQSCGGRVPHPNGRGTAAKTSAASSAPPVTAKQRALTVLVHIILHFVCFVLLVVPKRSTYGYTEAVYYHSMSYVWLIVGGAINVLRMPERFLTQMRARAYAQRVRLEEEDAQAACLRSLPSATEHRDGADKDMEDRETTSLLYTMAQRIARRCRRFSLCHFITHYVLSNRELDYCGNSHNLWHICTAISSFCMVAGAYYDCVEYELIRCA